MTFWKRQNYKDRKQISGCRQGLSGGTAYKGVQGMLKGDGNLYFDYGGYTIVCTYQNSQLYTFKKNELYYMKIIYQYICLFKTSSEQLCWQNHLMEWGYCIFYKVLQTIYPTSSISSYLQFLLIQYL